MSKNPNSPSKEDIQTELLTKMIMAATQSDLWNSISPDIAEDFL